MFLVLNFGISEILEEISPSEEKSNVFFAMGL